MGGAIFQAVSAVWREGQGMARGGKEREPRSANILPRERSARP